MPSGMFLAARWRAGGDNEVGLNGAGTCEQAETVMEISSKGSVLLDTPMLNKGSAFPEFFHPLPNALPLQWCNRIGAVEYDGVYRARASLRTVRDFVEDDRGFLDPPIESDEQADDHETGNRKQDPGAHVNRLHPFASTTS